MRITAKNRCGRSGLRLHRNRLGRALPAEDRSRGLGRNALPLVEGIWILVHCDLLSTLT